MSVPDVLAGTIPPTKNGPRALIAVCATLLPLATLLVGLRVWVRLRILKSWGWDDWAILASLVGSTFSSSEPLFFFFFFHFSSFTD